MATALTQMNTRIDAGEKRRGDAVLAKNGLSPSQAVRALWRYLAESEQLPDFMVAQDAGHEAAAQRAEAGAGMAVRLAEAAGLHCGALSGMSYDELREGAFEERLLEQDSGHA